MLEHVTIYEKVNVSRALDIAVYDWMKYLIINIKLGCHMGKYITASTKIRREFRDGTMRLGINISEVFRRRLEEAGVIEEVVGRDRGYPA